MILNPLKSGSDGSPVELGVGVEASLVEVGCPIELLFAVAPAEAEGRRSVLVLRLDLIHIISKFAKFHFGLRMMAIRIKS